MDGTWLEISISQCSQIGFTGSKVNTITIMRGKGAPRQCCATAEKQRDDLETLDELCSLSVIGQWSSRLGLPASASTDLRGGLICVPTFDRVQLPQPRNVQIMEFTTHRKQRKNQVTVSSAIKLHSHLSWLLSLSSFG